MPPNWSFRFKSPNDSITTGKRDVIQLSVDRGFFGAPTDDTRDRINGVNGILLPAAIHYTTPIEYFECKFTTFGHGRKNCSDFHSNRRLLIN